MSAQPESKLADLPDIELARLAAARDEGAITLITKRNNTRLYRAAWSVLRNRADAEDAVQSAYLSAIRAIENFEGRSSLSTWLTRIVVNEALARIRARRRWWSQVASDSIANLEHYRERLMRGSINWSHPEAKVVREQVRTHIEDALTKLPEKFRIVFVLREIEDMSVNEVAEALQIPAATVKTRQLRARLRLQSELAPELKSILSETLPFAGKHCEGITARVLEALCHSDDGEGGASGTFDSRCHPTS